VGRADGFLCRERRLPHTTHTTTDYANTPREKQANVVPMGAASLGNRAGGGAAASGALSSCGHRKRRHLTRGTGAQQKRKRAHGPHSGCHTTAKARTQHRAQRKRRARAQEEKQRWERLASALPPGATSHTCVSHDCRTAATSATASHRIAALSELGLTALVRAADGTVVFLLQNRISFCFAGRSELSEDSRRHALDEMDLVVIGDAHCCSGGWCG